MPSRRTVLGRLLGTVIGGSFAIGTTAGSETISQHASQSRTREQATVGDVTTVTATIDSSIISMVGMPAGFESTVAEFERTTGVSREDVGRITANGTLDGQTLSQGWALATGAFDVGRLRSQLREHDARFVQVNTADTPQEDRQSVVKVLQAREAPYTVRLEPTRLALATGGTRANRLETLATTASQGSIPMSTADAACSVNLGEGVRDRIRRTTQNQSASFETALEATRSAGVSLSVGPQTSRLGYRVVADSEQLTDSVVTELLDELDAQEGVELVNTDTDVDTVPGRIAATVEMANDRLWTVHMLRQSVTGFRPSV